jgi:hypothetical protein
MTMVTGYHAKGVTRCPLITTIGLGSACQGTPLIRPCRLDDGIHAVDTPDKHHRDPDYALNGLHPHAKYFAHELSRRHSVADFSKQFRIVKPMDCWVFRCTLQYIHSIPSISSHSIWFGCDAWVAEGVGIPIYEQIRDRIKSQVAIGMTGENL